MSDRIDEIESRLRELGPKQAADGGSTAEPAAEPPVRESGPGEGAPGEPGGSPATRDATGQGEGTPSGPAAPAQQPESAPHSPEPGPRPEAVPELKQEAEPVVEHAEGELRVPDGYQVLSGGVDGRRAVGVVVSRFNGEITDRLLKRALDELEEVGVPREAIMVMPVPGAFELPLAAMALAKTRRYACIVALGCVIRGETPHFELIAHEAASGLQLAAIETGVPVAFGVLTVENRQQAEERIDKAAEAVRSALEMADVFSQLRASAAGPLQ
jgi:6,7-dimethyl-8-ribityllumazine synthase